MLRPVDFRDLERQAEGFTTKNHHRFLSEALACLRQTRDPVAAFELLARMHPSARKDEADALHDIVTWLRAQLHGPIHLTPDALELRLAWTRRIARIATSRNSQHPRDGARAVTTNDRERPMRGGPARPNSPRPPAPDQELRQFRQRYPQPPPLPPPPRPPGFRPASASAPEPAQEPRHPPLPDVLKVMFSDQREAATLLKRLVKASPGQAGAPSRPPRPLPLVLQKDGPLVPPDLGPVFLVCAATTPGLADYIKKLNAESGRAFEFYVTALEYDGDRLLARHLLLDPPDPPSPSP